MAEKTMLLKVAGSDPERFVFVTADYAASRTPRHTSEPLSEEQARTELKVRYSDEREINGMIEIARRNPASRA